jgi:tryptophan-rich sensory protein
MADRRQSTAWYQQLKRPAWAPPSWVFSPVWAILYLIIAISFGAVFVAAFNNDVPLGTALPFLFNLISNFAFSPIQFGLKHNLLAATDIVIVLGTLVWGMIVIWPEMRWVTYANIPYLLWVTFATVLQFTVTYLNRSRSAES